MSLDPQKLTQKTIEALNAASRLAQEEQHVQVTPVHLASTLFDDAQGIGHTAAVRVAGEDGWKGICRCAARQVAFLHRIAFRASGSFHCLPYLPEAHAAQSASANSHHFTMFYSTFYG